MFATSSSIRFHPTFVDRIEVNNTLFPNQDGDAIGGSVNLVTKTPTTKPTYDFGTQGGYTSIQGGRSLYGLNGTIGFRHDKALGILVGGTYDHNNRGVDDMEPTQAIGNFNGRNFAYIMNQDLRTYQYYRSRYGFDVDADYNIKPGWTAYVRGLLAEFHDDGNVFVYTPNAGGIVPNSGSQTLFDDTGNMQYREYVRRPDQGVFSVATGSDTRHFLHCDQLPVCGLPGPQLWRSGFRNNLL
jgi:hypothetical protein